MMAQRIEIKVKSTGWTYGFHNVTRFRFKDAKAMRLQGHDTKNHEMFLEITFYNEFTDTFEEFYFPVDDIEISC